MPGPAIKPVPPAEEENGRRVSVWRRLARAPVEWAKVVLFPFETVPRVVRAGRFGGVLLAVTLCAGLAVVAVAPRLDMAPGLLRKESHPQAARPGQEQQAEEPMSDREFDEAVEKAHAVEIVKLSGKALLVPLRLLLLGLVLFGVARFVGGKPALRGAMALSAHAGLPGAIKALVAAAAALRASSLTPEAVATLVPLPWGAPGGPPLARLLATLDPFTLWAVVLLAIGLPHAAGIGRGKAYATLGVCFVLFVLLSL